METTSSQAASMGSQPFDSYFEPLLNDVEISEAEVGEGEQKVPGCDMLGMGFDIRKKFFVPSLTKSVAALGELNHSFRDYKVPENVRVIEKSSYIADFKTVSSRTEFNNNFASKAGLTVNTVAFDGEFNVAYKEVTQNKAENFYSFYQYSSELWSLSLDSSEATAHFLKDIKNLPEDFTNQNANQFFAIFKRYGTHFVDNVTMGGNLVMYTSLASTEGFTTKEFSASMKAEYEGLFTTVKGSAEMKWKEVNKEMFKKQTFNLFCNGGDASMASAGIVPDANYNEQFTAWIKSCETKPSMVGFSLTPIAFVAPLELQDALLEATDAYTKGAIHSNAALTIQNTEGNVKIGTASMDVYIGGKFVAPPTPTDNPHRSKVVAPSGNCDLPCPTFRVTIFTEKTPFKVLFDKVYYANNVTIGEVNNVYTQIMDDIKKATESLDDKYYASFAASTAIASYPPTENLANWLKTIGAGKVLNVWLDSKKSPYDDLNIGFYTCAGKANNSEAKADEDWYNISYMYNTFKVGRIKAESLLVF